MAYKHTQKGILILWIIFFMGAFFGFILTKTGFDILIIIVMAIVLTILAGFSSLTVSIEKNDLNVKFGPGIFKKTFNIKEITSVKTVKNHWYYGWGIRIWLWPKMWIFNVSGFDAVEIKLKNGVTYRIGTDEPKKLAKAIK